MTCPRALVAELQEKFGRLLLDHSFPLDGRGAIDLDYVRRACAQRVEIVRWLDGAVRAGAALRRVHGRRPHPPPRAGRTGSARGRESTVAEVYRILDGALGDLLKAVGASDGNGHGGGNVHGRLRPRRRLALRRRQPQRLARAGGLAHVRRTSRARATRKLGHQLFELRRRFPKGLRYSFKQRMPWLRERAYELRGYSIVDWPRTQAFSYGHVRQHRDQPARPRARTGSSSPARSTSALRDEIVERALDLRSPAGEPIVDRRAPPRGALLGPGAREDPRPDRRVPRLRVARQGQHDGPHATRSGTRSRSRRTRARSTRAATATTGIFVLAGPGRAAAGRALREHRGRGADGAVPARRADPVRPRGPAAGRGDRARAARTRPPEYADTPEIEVASAHSYEGESPAEVEERLRASATSSSAAWGNRPSARP